MPKTILLAGATGLVGSAVLPLLLADERVGKAVALVRRPLNLVHPKLEQWAGEDLLDALRPEAVDAVICCLGTTIKKAGSQAAFIAVDKSLPLGIARWAKERGVQVFCGISAMGAASGSRIFYNRVKGEVEEELEKTGFRSLAIFQPSLLTGPRKERRSGEGIASGILRAAGPFMAGSLANYRAMPHDVLAKALVQAAVEPAEGVKRYRYRAILGLAG